MKGSRNKGFTLIELLVVVVLGTLALMAIYQVLATSTRVFAINGARIQGQQTLRGGLDILFGELREVSPLEGDLIEIGPDSVTFRAQRTFGVACAVDYTQSPVELTAYRVGPAFQDNDSILVFHDNDPTRVSDDEWFAGTVSSVDATATCSDGSPAQVLSIPVLRTTATKVDPDSVRVGAPVRGFETFTYSTVLMDGETYLARRARGSSTPDLLAGPFPSDRGLAFRYLNGQGVETTNPLEVAQIEILLRYQSDLAGFANRTVTDSVTARVFPRN